MKKNRWFLRALVLLALTGALSMTVTLAAEPGSSKDPLVTLSYLNETFMDSILFHGGDAVRRSGADRRHRL